MSEYQYYEFRAIDRPLNAKEQSELRACSTRARITSTSFINGWKKQDFKIAKGMIIICEDATPDLLGSPQPGNY